SNSVFGQIVNSNLEVRTSVSIDPETGAAQEGALFTYEAIPRTTIFYFEVVYQNPEHFEISNKINLNKVISTVETGFKLFDSLGVGGMETRGFGKLKVFGLDKKFDPVELAEIQIKNMNNKLQEIDEELKSASDEKKSKLEDEKESIKNKINKNAEMFAKLADIYKAIDGD
ncbi:MAG: RAMP superfamily CRISPR-associated protein, partial [Methanosarcinales archaeon]